MPYLEVRETKYILRPLLLPVPRVAHSFAESCLLYKLLKIKNELAPYHKLILAKIIIILIMFIITQVSAIML